MTVEPLAPELSSPKAAVGPARRDEWSAIAAADPAALPEQTPEWIDAICDGTSFVDVSRRYDLADGRTFVLPLVRRRGTPRAAAQLWSFPNAWGIGGPVGAGLDRSAVDLIVDDLAALGVARVSVRVDPVADGHWRHLATDDRVLVVPRTAHVADLHGDADTHLAALSKQTRFNIRKAGRRGVRVEVGAGGALLADHYELFLRSVERWAGSQHEPLVLARWRAARRDPLAKLERIGRHLGDRFRVVVGYVDDRPAASAIVLLGATTRYTRGAIDTELTRGTCANDAVHWRAVELAYEHGARRYNMGETGSATGLARFKERFGAVAVPYGEYRLESLPITGADRAMRGVVKRIVGFQDR